MTKPSALSFPLASKIQLKKQLLLFVVTQEPNCFSETKLKLASKSQEQTMTFRTAKANS